MEIEIGIGRLASHDPIQASHLQAWLYHDVLHLFKEQLLDIDLNVAHIAAKMHIPSPRPERDTLIAATAQAHNLTVVTRNVKDFERLGINILNPWE